jgi:hypothetical protein
MIREQQQIRRCPEFIIGIGEHPWIYVPVRTDQRLSGHLLIKMQRQLLLFMIGIEISVG